MRKWMRDRLQRGKKKPAEPSDQPVPPPLQPAYFEAEQEPGPAPGSGHMESEISEPPPPLSDSPGFKKARTHSEEEPSEAQPASSQPTSRGSEEHTSELQSRLH